MKYRIVLLLLTLSPFIFITAQNEGQEVNTLQVEEKQNISTEQEETPESNALEINPEAMTNFEEHLQENTAINSTEEQQKICSKYSRGNRVKRASHKTNQITDISSQSQLSHKKEVKKIDKDIFKWLSIIIFTYVAIRVTWYRYKRKCPICKKWNSMKNIKTICFDEKPTTIIEKRSRKNGQGQVLETWEVDVPATKYYYNTYRKCKHCGHKDIVRSNEIRKN